MDIIESKLNRLRDTTADQSRYTVSTRKIAEDKALRETKRQEYEKIRKELIADILETIALAANHRESAQKCINDVKNEYGMQLEIFFSKVSGINPMMDPSNTLRRENGDKFSSLSPINGHDEVWNMLFYFIPFINVFVQIE